MQIAPLPVQFEFFSLTNVSVEIFEELRFVSSTIRASHVKLALFFSNIGKSVTVGKT